MLNQRWDLVRHDVLEAGPAAIKTCQVTQLPSRTSCMPPRERTRAHTKPDFSVFSTLSDNAHNVMKWLSERDDIFPAEFIEEMRKLTDQVRSGHRHNR
jgi:predicted unusual protein kinase regulating ubiquinone biosynthesis (AarF/ABC1/UbiB family)